MKLSLIVSTYNRPDALAAVLAAALRQTRAPDEILVGDDGSGPDTAAAVARAAASGAARSVRVEHVWREKAGFRLAHMRNAAVAASTGDYLVFLDGDAVPHRRFVEDHLNAARPGRLAQGSRALADEARTAAILADGPVAAPWPDVFARGVSNRKNLVWSPALSRLFSRERAGLKGVRGCNLACTRADFLAANGFNEDFVGWGREDSEFVARLLHAGARRLNLRFAALTLHLWHPENARAALPRNDALLAETLRTRATRCARGFDTHLEKQPTHRIR